MFLWSIREQIQLCLITLSPYLETPGADLAVWCDPAGHGDLATLPLVMAGLVALPAVPEHDDLMLA